MKIFAIVFSIVMSVCFAAVCAIELWYQYGLWSLASYAAIILALPLSSLLHELGHMLFGAIVNIKAVPKFSLFGSSSCKIIPQTDKSLRFKVGFTAVGGLVVNFLFAILGLIPLFVSAVPMCLCIFLPASTYLFLMNVYAVEFTSGKTDGLVVYELIENGAEAKVLLSVLTVQAQVLNGKPIEEVDEKLLFDLPQIREDDPAFISLAELRYEYFEAKGEEKKAEVWKTRFEELKKEYE